MNEHDKVVRSTKRWLADFVIKLNLCPFAKREYLSNTIRFVVCDGKQDVDLMERLHAEINHLIASPNVSTTLLIHPNVLNDFDEYNQFLDLAEGLLEQQGWLGKFQLASFHPDYQFANTTNEDAENFTNRSPYPMLHILREEQVEKAIENHANIEQVPFNNIQVMQDIGTRELRSQLNACLDIPIGEY